MTTTALANHDAETTDLRNAAALVREVAAILNQHTQMVTLAHAASLLDDVAGWLATGNPPHRPAPARREPVYGYTTADLARLGVNADLIDISATVQVNR